MPKIEVLKKRNQFVRITKQGFSLPTKTIVLQAIKNNNTEDMAPRIGYTTTKKIGKAHIRNRCRRRLRAAAALLFAKHALPNCDYVLIARYSTEQADFNKLCDDLKFGIGRINKMLNGEQLGEKK